MLDVVHLRNLLKGTRPQVLVFRRAEAVHFGDMLADRLLLLAASGVLMIIAFDDAVVEVDNLGAWD